MQGCRGVRLGHGRYVGGIGVPRAHPIHGRDQSQSSHVAVAAGEEVLAGGVARGGRVGRNAEAIGKIVLEKAFDAVQVLEDELVAGVQFDSGFSVDALGVELGAKPALWPRAIATRFPRPAYFALRDWSVSMFSGFQFQLQFQ